VVIADWVFTTTTIVFQPLSGWRMAHLAGLPLTTPWIAWSLALYVLAGACWLPVVWMQVRMRRMAEQAVRDGSPMPAGLLPPARGVGGAGHPGLPRAGGGVLADGRKARLSRGGASAGLA
jgi:hypothetical protein